MANRGAGCWEIRLSGSVRDWATTQAPGVTLNLSLTSGEFPVYSNNRSRNTEDGQQGKQDREVVFG
jgi:hypothetical protein